MSLAVLWPQEIACGMTTVSEDQERTSVAAEWTWQASGNVDGYVAEICPDSESDIRFPKPRDTV